MTFSLPTITYALAGTPMPLFLKNSGGLKVTP